MGVREYVSVSTAALVVAKISGKRRKIDRTDDDDEKERLLLSGDREETRGLYFSTCLRVEATTTIN